MNLILKILDFILISQSYYSIVIIKYLAKFQGTTIIVNSEDYYSNHFS